MKFLAVIQYHEKGKGANFAHGLYKDGFGSVEQGSFWIGLENMHKLTKTGSYGLQVDIKEGDGVVRTLEYDFFRVSNEADNYRLYLTGFKSGTSNSTDRMNYHNNKPFTTTDRDNDNHPTSNCASEYGGSGWWYSACYTANLNHPDGPTWTKEDRHELESKMTLIKSSYE